MKLLAGGLGAARLPWWESVGQVACLVRTIDDTAEPFSWFAVKLVGSRPKASLVCLNLGVRTRFLERVRHVC